MVRGRPQTCIDPDVKRSKLGWVLGWVRGVNVCVNVTSHYLVISDFVWLDDLSID